MSSRAKRLASGATACAVAFCCAASCIDDGTGTIFVDFGSETSTATFVESEDGLRIRVELEPYIDSDGEVLLDSALLVVNHDGQTTSLPDPDIEALGFPLRSGQPTITLEVPSPITDITSFDSFCDSNGRSVDATLRFFVTSIDPDPELPPPVTELAINLPLAVSGVPEAPNVIGAAGVTSFGPGGNLVVDNVVTGVAENILFVVGAEEAPGTFTGYRADVDQQESLELYGYQAFPRLASNDLDVLYVAGATDSGSLRFERLAGTEAAELLIDRDTSAPAYDTFNVVAMEPTATGMRAVVISSFSLTGPLLATPPDDKYYGCFIVEAEYADGVLSATSVVGSDREIVSWLPLTDGLLQISTELPPRSADTTLRVERLDEVGAVSWVHDVPVTGHDVDVDTLPDGTVVVAYELSSGFIEVLRLAVDDGSELARASFSGDHPTLAAYGAEHVLLSFSGRAPQEGVLAPARPVPLLLELDADMDVVRGTQIACSGSADLQRAADGSPLLVAVFDERFSLGENVTEAKPGELILTKIAEPL